MKKSEKLYTSYKENDSNQKKYSSCGKEVKKTFFTHKTKKILWIVVPALIVFILLLLSYFAITASGMFSNKVTPSIPSESAPTSAEITVPNLVDLNFENIKQSLEKTEEFKLLLLDKKFSDTIEKGCIISHVPEKGSTVQRGSIIAATVSIGAKSRTLPDIVGLSIFEACLKLSAEGLIPIQNQQYNDNIPEGIIISYENCSAGQKVDYGSEIKIIVSLGLKTS